MIKNATEAKSLSNKIENGDISHVLILIESSAALGRRQIEIKDTEINTRQIKTLRLEGFDVNPSLRTFIISW